MTGVAVGCSTAATGSSTASSTGRRPSRHFFVVSVRHLTSRLTEEEEQRRVPFFERSSQVRRVLARDSCRRRWALAPPAAAPSSLSSRPSATRALRRRRRRDAAGVDDGAASCAFRALAAFAMPTWCSATPPSTSSSTVPISLRQVNGLWHTTHTLVGRCGPRFSFARRVRSPLSPFGILLSPAATSVDAAFRRASRRYASVSHVQNASASPTRVDARHVAVLRRLFVGAVSSSSARRSSCHKGAVVPALPWASFLLDVAPACTARRPRRHGRSRQLVARRPLCRHAFLTVLPERCLDLCDESVGASAAAFCGAQSIARTVRYARRARG